MKIGNTNNASMNTGLNINRPSSGGQSLGNSNASFAMPLNINKPSAGSDSQPPGGIDPNR